MVAQFEDLETDDEKVSWIGNRLTDQEWEWFAMREWGSGVRNGREAMLKEVLAAILAEAGELYANGSDDGADEHREMARWLKAKVKP